MNGLHQMPESNDLHVVYMTALEMPKLTSLHASQVLAPAALLARRGFRVTWVAVIPFRVTTNFLEARSNVRQVRTECARNGIDFVSFYAPLLSVSWLATFFLRDTFFPSVARKIFSAVKWGNQTILHSRSYIATELALHLRDLLGRDRAKVSFDMRSVLPEEVPLASRGKTGVMAFGFLKQWEFELLKKSDVSMLPLHYARERIYNETGVSVQYMPVQGFDREPGWQADFEKRWKHSRLGYAGSIGPWHSPDILLQIFRSLPWANPSLAMKRHPLFAQYDCREYANSAMPEYYDGLLGLVIPGRQSSSDYFMSFQMRCNLFSTKASEALSRGVPLIVSSKLFGLASFVRSNKCGFIYDPDLNRFEFPDSCSVRDKDTWEELTRNAVVVGKQFERSEIVNDYLDCWMSLFEVDAIQR